jgi:hypothetical protein
MRLMQNSPDPYARTFKAPKWNRYVRVTDVPRLFRQLPEFAGWTRARHEAMARSYLDNAIVTERMYHATASRALIAYGDHGSLISGIVRDHFPEATKTDLRTLCSLFARDFERSVAHWAAAGRRIETWRACRDEWRVRGN